MHLEYDRMFTSNTKKEKRKQFCIYIKDIYNADARWRRLETETMQ